MATINFHSQFLALTLLLIHVVNSTIQATNHGFEIDLIHRDSPNSPLYNPNRTPLERYNDAFRRAYSRLNRLNVTSFNPNAAYSNVSANNGEYLMKFSMGKPPVDIYGIVDTGSDLMWTQCLPCEQCYKQVKPVYNPTASSSYDKLSCQSEQCHLLDSVSCSSQQFCNYTYGYADSSLTKGVLSTETITFGSSSGNSISFKNIVFGCGHNNTGTFNENEMGLIGLGGRNSSLAFQVCSKFGTKKFSHCLVPFHTDPSLTSKMYFGSNSEVSGPGVVSTPLVPKDGKITFYFVTLEGISVGDKFIPYNSSRPSSKGNMLIDSGTPPTLLHKDFYKRLEDEVRGAIKLTPYQDPQLGTQLCYKSQSVIDIDAPILTAQFDGGGQVPLIQTSTFIPPLESVFCFAMQPIDDGDDVGIFGNFAQSSLLIDYDLDKQIVSFMPTDCTKQH